EANEKYQQLIEGYVQRHWRHPIYPSSPLPSDLVPAEIFLLGGKPGDKRKPRLVADFQPCNAQLPPEAFRPVVHQVSPLMTFDATSAEGSHPDFFSDRTACGISSGLQAMEESPITSNYLTDTVALRLLAYNSVKVTYQKVAVLRGVLRFWNAYCSSKKRYPFRQTAQRRARDDDLAQPQLLMPARLPIGLQSSGYEINDVLTVFRLCQRLDDFTKKGRAFVYDESTDLWYLRTAQRFRFLLSLDAHARAGHGGATPTVTAMQEDIHVIGASTSAKDSSYGSVDFIGRLNGRSRVQEDFLGRRALMGFEASREAISDNMGNAFVPFHSQMDIWDGIQLILMSDASLGAGAARLWRPSQEVRHQFLLNGAFGAHWRQLILSFLNLNKPHSSDANPGIGRGYLRTQLMASLANGAGTALTPRPTMMMAELSISASQDMLINYGIWWVSTLSVHMVSGDAPSGYIAARPMRISEPYGYGYTRPSALHYAYRQRLPTDPPTHFLSVDLGKLEIEYLNVDYLTYVRSLLSALSDLQEKTKASVQVHIDSWRSKQADLRERSIKETPQDYRLSLYDLVCTTEVANNIGGYLNSNWRGPLTVVRLAGTSMVYLFDGILLPNDYGSNL
ncbi:hypothetical protein FOZ62_021791, partial [Perkinsus olseni]